MKQADTQKKPKGNLEKRLGIGTLVTIGLGTGMMYIGLDSKGTFENSVSQHGYGMIWGACIATGGYYLTKIGNSYKNRNKED